MDMGMHPKGLKGTIVHPRNIKIDGRGIPTNVPGVYKPTDWSRYVAVKWDNGKFDVVAKSHIDQIGRK
jgi:hypothetical protein